MIIHTHGHPPTVRRTRPGSTNPPFLMSCRFITEFTDYYICTPLIAIICPGYAIPILYPLDSNCHPLLLLLIKLAINFQLTFLITPRNLELCGLPLVFNSGRPPPLNGLICSVSSLVPVGSSSLHHTTAHFVRCQWDREKRSSPRFCGVLRHFPQGEENANS